MHVCFVLFPLFDFSFVDFPSVLWYCWLGLLTCKNRLPYNLYCVGWDVQHCTTNQIQCSVYPVYCGTLSFHVLLWLCTWNEPWGMRSQSAESFTVDSCYTDDSLVSPVSAGQAASQPQCLSATSVRHRCKLSLLTNRHSSTYRTLGVPLAHTPDWLAGWLAGWLTDCWWH